MHTVNERRQHCRGWAAEKSQERQLALQAGSVEDTLEPHLDNVTTVRKRLMGQGAGRGHLAAGSHHKHHVLRPKILRGWLQELIGGGWK